MKLVYKWKALRGLTAKTSAEYSMVLQAIRIPHRTIRTMNRRRILIPDIYFDLAIKELKEYRSENRIPEKQDEDVSKRLYDITAVFLVFLSLALFHFYIINNGLYSAFVSFGSSNSGSILNGEFYRMITSLTLHADAGHLISNIVFGCFTVYFLFRRTGGGLGLFVLLISGGFGNGINALLQGPGYSAIGSSAALFGGLGILAAIETVMAGKNLKRIQWKPLAGALALLSFLGTSPGSDLGGHFFSFIAGIPIGLICGFVIKKSGRPYFVIQAAFATGAIGTLIICWNPLFK